MAHSLSEAFNADDEALLQYLLAVKRHAAAVNKFSEADVLMRIFSKRLADGAHMREELVHTAWDMLDFQNLHNDEWVPEARAKKTETLNLAAFPDLLRELPPESHKAIQDSYHLASTSEALSLDGLKNAMKPYRTERTRRLREVEAAQKAVDLAWQNYKDKYKAREVRLATELGAGLSAETLYRNAAEIPKGAPMMVITITKPMPLPFGGFVPAPPAVVPEAVHEERIRGPRKSADLEVDTTMDATQPVQQADGWLDSWIDASDADDSSTQSHKDTAASGGRAPPTQPVFNMQEEEVQYSGDSEDEKNNGYEGSEEGTNAARSPPGDNITQDAAATPPTPAREGVVDDGSDEKERETKEAARSPPGDNMAQKAGSTPPSPAHKGVVHQGSDEKERETKVAARSPPGDNMAHNAGSTPPSPAHQGDIKELRSRYEQSDEKERVNTDAARSPPGNEMTLNAGVTPPTPQVEQDGADRELLVDEGPGGQDGHVTTDADTTTDNTTQDEPPRRQGRPRQYNPGYCLICPPETAKQPVSTKFQAQLCKRHIRKFTVLLESVRAEPDCDEDCSDDGPCDVCVYEQWVQRGVRPPPDGE